jgi:hypothetical protein
MKGLQSLNRLQALLEHFHYHGSIPTLTDRLAASQEKVGSKWFPRDQSYQKQGESHAVLLRQAGPNILGSGFAIQCRLWLFSTKKSLA